MEAATPRANQMDFFNFLVRAGWSRKALEEASVRQRIGERDCAGMPIHVIFDGTGVPKQGELSVGLPRQYPGCAVGEAANERVVLTLLDGPFALLSDFDVPDPCPGVTMMTQAQGPYYVAGTTTSVHHGWTARVHHGASIPMPCPARPA